MKVKEAKKGREDRSEEAAADQQIMVDALATALLKATQQQNGAMGTDLHMSQEAGKSIDLVELFYHILSKIVYVIAAAVLGAVLLGFNTQKSVPIYTATAKLYIVGSQGTNLNIADLQIGTLLSADYQEVFKTWEVHELVRQKLNLNMSYAQMQGMLTVSIPEDTRVLYISVRNPNAQLAADLANAYAEAGKTFILQTMDTEEPNNFSVALVPSVGAVVTTTSRVMIGFLLGLVLSLGIIVLRFVMDDRPRTPEDIAQVADIPTLTVIPAANKRSRNNLLKGKGKKHSYEED